VVLYCPYNWHLCSWAWILINTYGIYWNWIELLQIITTAVIVVVVVAAAAATATTTAIPFLFMVWYYLWIRNLIFVNMFNTRISELSFWVFFLHRKLFSCLDCLLVWTAYRCCIWSKTYIKPLICYMGFHYFCCCQAGVQLVKFWSSFLSQSFLSPLLSHLSLLHWNT